MKGKVLTQNAIDDFAAYLKNEEKGENTIQKYIHDIQDFMRFSNADTYALVRIQDHRGFT